MLKNIRLHINNDESKQAEIEALSAKSVEENYKNNLRAFLEHIPSLAEYLNTTVTTNISIFTNKFGHFNFVDYGAGRTLYGLHPEEEIKKQVENYSRWPVYIDFKAKGQLSASSPPDNLAELFKSQHKSTPLDSQIEVLIVLGIGIGYHLLDLIENYNIKHLVIYEPELQYFKSSAYCADWKCVLETAKKKGVGLYFQLGKDGRDIINDTAELRLHFPVKGFYLYKHYNHPVFNQIEKNCLQRCWPDIESKGIQFGAQEAATDYLPNWTPSVPLDKYTVCDAATSEQFKANLAAFEHYFPDIYFEFKEYKTTNWLPIAGENGEINLVKKDIFATWYGDSPRTECLINFQNYSEQPNKDGLVLGYKGTKLKHYTHYKFVAETEELLAKQKEEQGSLPQTIKSLILFGVGVGYQIEQLFDQHQVEKLFICEPNRDFFYASLFAIDWAGILEKIDADNGRLYINIGDDGTNLFRDLLSQFYSIGPYILANTYFYQSYYNSILVNAISQLREQLQIVISMGEYYDHARYGIAQTSEMLSRKSPLLRASPAKLIDHQTKEIPVFIIGNGPSLDNAIQTIKEWQGQAIIVSCGTALMPLHKHGIVPDFHAEIEQNRSTFDWICRIGDFEFLKNISLISCNGIHPDTCELFKDVYLAFKEGESSTISALEILGKQNYTELKFAFPTVSNFSLNLFSVLGFNQIYLFGVDLGFADKKQHHSQLSGYYREDGNEAYDYEAKNNTSILVPGNFRKNVFTKHEFKVSKAIIEQTLRHRKIECFNCSDGAKIEGAQPLALDYVLLTATESQKQAAIASIKVKAFSSENLGSHYLTQFSKKYAQSNLSFELKGFISNVDAKFTNLEQVDRLIESQKDMLFASYQHGQSLLFYLLYGTVNYANSVFSKIAAIGSDDKKILEVLNQVRVYWLQTLNNIKQDSVLGVTAYDSSSALFKEREKVFLKKQSAYKHIGYYTDSKLVKFALEKFQLLSDATANFTSLNKSVDYNIRELIVMVENLENLEDIINFIEHYIRVNQRVESLTIALPNYESIKLVEAKLSNSSISLSFILGIQPIDTNSKFSDFQQGRIPYFYPKAIPYLLLKAHFNNELFRLQLPKMHFTTATKLQRKLFFDRLNLPEKLLNAYEFKSNVCQAKVRGSQFLLDKLGNRGDKIQQVDLFEIVCLESFHYSDVQKLKSVIEQYISETFQ